MQSRQRVLSRRVSGAMVVAAVCALLTTASAQSRQGEQWVSTWATAQQLVAGGDGRGRAGGPTPPSQTPPVVQQPGSAAAGRSGGATARTVPLTLEDETVRMVVRTSLGGRAVRVSFSNMLNASPLEIGAAHLATHAGGSAIVVDTDRALTFGGKSSVIVPPGALLLSDPVNLTIAPLSDLAVSVYLPRSTGAPTSHTLGLRTAFVSKGNVTSRPTMPDDATTTLAYLWLSSVDVLAPAGAGTIVAFGDSITDGYSTTPDANQAWPTLLARRLQGNKATRHLGVVNQGISGNQVLRNGAGLSALARFDRDVLSRPGVRWVILLEGINDINIRGGNDGPDALTSEELIGGYQQIIARAHAHGLRVIGATLTPEEGVRTATDRGEAIRQAVNRWIRQSGSFDAVVDFDAVLRDPARPARLRSEFDPGDHIHPNDLGNQAMAEAFDLTVFVK